jgi:hypothetical protein
MRKTPQHVSFSNLHGLHVDEGVSFDFRVLNFDGNNSPIFQRRLVNLGQGCCTQGLRLKGDKQLFYLQREKKEKFSSKNV